MNRIALFDGDGAKTVHRLADHIQDASQHLTANGYRNGLPRILHRNTPHQAIGRLHRDGPYGGFTEMLGYLDGLREADLQRKARIPLFKQFMGTDEIPIPMFVGAMLDFHWNDHAGQLAKIRQAVGLPEAR